MSKRRSTTDHPGARRGPAPSDGDPRRPAVLAAAIALLAAGAAAAGEATILFRGPAEGGTWLGVQQGFDEATVLGRFAGHDLRLVTAPPAGEPPVAVIAAVPPAELAELTAAWEERGVAVLDVLARDDAPRPPCRPNLLHVAPSPAMKRDALAQWHRLHPGDDAEARAWHPAFRKFSATELNSRFRERHGRPMDDDAWAAWAAVKMVAEAVVRSGFAEPPRVLDYLRREMAFDGVKGIALSFRSDGQLRQPVLIVVADRPVGEAPVAGVADPEDLDSLGGEPACGD